jgi:cytochrome c553
MNRNTIGACLAAVSLVLSGHAIGGDADAGKKVAEAKQCGACHAADGNSTIPMNPIIAGQYESYLLRALSEYKSGARNNAIMSSQAVGLTDQEIRDLAAYFSSQESALSVLNR